jgi:phosphoserine phosphatase
MRELGLERSWALMLEIDNGVYSGRIVGNAGVASAKAGVCRLLARDEESDVALAFGDSEGDRLMWREARIAIRVGGDAHDPEVTLSGLDLDQPLDDRLWSIVPTASWLREVRPACDQ